MEAYATGAMVACSCWMRAAARRALTHLEQTVAEFMIEATRFNSKVSRESGEERESCFSPYSFRRITIVIMID